MLQRTLRAGEWVHDAQPMFHAETVVQFPAPQCWHVAISGPDTNPQPGTNLRLRRIELRCAPNDFHLSPLADNRFSQYRDND